MATQKGSDFDRGNKGKVIYNVGIVKGIVKLAVEDVEGVAVQCKRLTGGDKSIKVTMLNGSINVNVNVSVYYGYSIPDVAYNIQTSVKHSVESMSKYKIGNVDVNIDGVVFPEENTID